jgi:hypothetical protein
MARKLKSGAKITSKEELQEHAVLIPGVQFASERHAAIMGLKLAGLWHRGSCVSLAAQWGTTGEAVGIMADKVDQVLEQLVSKDPTRRLVLHQLLLALSEANQIEDVGKRVFARVRVVGELAKVTGLVKNGATFIAGGFPSLSDESLQEGK